MRCSWVMARRSPRGVPRSLYGTSRSFSETANSADAVCHSPAGTSWWNACSAGGLAWAVRNDSGKNERCRSAPDQAICTPSVVVSTISGEMEAGTSDERCSFC